MCLNLNDEVQPLTTHFLVRPTTLASSLILHVLRVSQLYYHDAGDLFQVLNKSPFFHFQTFLCDSLCMYIYIYMNPWSFVSLLNHWMLAPKTKQLSLPYGVNKFKTLTETHFTKKSKFCWSIPSMGLVYLPTFTTKKQKTTIHVGKYTFLTQPWMVGYRVILFFALWSKDPLLLEPLFAGMGHGSTWLHVLKPVPGPDKWWSWGTCGKIPAWKPTKIKAFM